MSKTDLGVTKTVTPSQDEIAIDDLMGRGLKAIQGIMKAIQADVATGAPKRETIQNLKDMMGVLKDLKKDEKDILASLSQEDLERIVKK